MTIDPESARADPMTANALFMAAALALIGSLGGGAGAHPGRMMAVGETQAHPPATSLRPRLRPMPVPPSGKVRPKTRPAERAG